MGDFVEMILDGDLCESCGEYIDEPGYGIPRRCAGCCAPPPPRQPKPKRQARGKSRAQVLRPKKEAGNG